MRNERRTEPVSLTCRVVAWVAPLWLAAVAAAAAALSAIWFTAAEALASPKSKATLEIRVAACGGKEP